VQPATRSLLFKQFELPVAVNDHNASMMASNANVV
jgi:hypothetical protein